MIYLDNNATTRIDSGVVEAMEPFLTELYGNASSSYMFARESSNAVAAARAQVAGLAGVEPSRVIFTSCATESNNAVISGVLEAAPDRRKIVISAIEHPSIHGVCNYLEAKGLEIVRVGVNRDGALDFQSLEEALTNDTALLSVMAANNETGVLFPLEKIGEMAKERGILFHTDAAQAAGKIAMRTDAWQADFLSLSAHKFHGPKGVGALINRTENDLPPFIKGGDQEQGRRSGTENIAGIIGMGRAAERAQQRLSGMPSGVSVLRDRLERGLVEGIRNVTVVGENQDRLPNTSTLLFADFESEALLARLDMAGICCSAGSACSAGSVEPSRVLLGMGYGPDEVQGSIRFSLSCLNSQDEVDTAIEKTVEICNILSGKP